MKRRVFDADNITRKRNVAIETFLQSVIDNDTTGTWNATASENFGLDFQRSVASYFEANKEAMGIATVECNLNPSDPRPDVVLTKKDGSVEVIEVKSVKDEMLGGSTICNHPSLLKDVLTYLVNYTLGTEKIVVRCVIETQLHRLTGVMNGKSKYAGCLRSNRDSGKRVKGREFWEFMHSDPANDRSLKELTDPKLIAKTELNYTIAKLVPGGYSTQEVADAYDFHKQFKKD